MILMLFQNLMGQVKGNGEKGIQKRFVFSFVNAKLTEIFIDSMFQFGIVDLSEIYSEIGRGYFVFFRCRFIIPVKFLDKVGIFFFIEIDVPKGRL